jgi:hypothetical protein
MVLKGRSTLKTRKLLRLLLELVVVLLLLVVESAVEFEEELFPSIEIYADMTTKKSSTFHRSLK